MAEPPARWDEQDDPRTTASSSLSATLGKLNVNAMEFVPNFGGGFSSAPKAAIVPQPIVPRTPPSTPVVPRATTEDEKKQTEPMIKADDLIIQQQQVKEPVTTAEEREFDDLPDEDIESKLVF